MMTVQTTGLENVRVIEIASSIKGSNLEKVAEALAKTAAEDSASIAKS